MASNCKACSDLREYAPEFVTNGVTDNVFLSLENDNGLGNHEDHTDCDDLVDAVDCLVGNMDDEIEAYEICSWKDYMHKLVPNLHQTIKAVIGSICGLWNNVCRLWCYVNFFLKGVELNVTEDASPTSDAYVVAGRGVSFLKGGVNVQLKSYGNIVKFRGSVHLYTDDATDEGECARLNQKNGNETTPNRNILGNTFYDREKNTVEGGELLYELRLKKSAYPFLKYMEVGFGTTSLSSGASRIINVIFNDDEYAYGYHGTCSRSDGTASKSDFASGHKVKDGFVYIQQRIVSFDTMDGDKIGGPNGKQHSPRSIVFMEFEPEDITCGDLGNYENCENDLHQVEEE